MKQLALSAFPFPILTAVGLLIFFFFFVGVVWWVFRRGSTELYTDLSKLPLQKEQNNE